MFWLVGQLGFRGRLGAQTVQGAGKVGSLLRHGDVDRRGFQTHMTEDFLDAANVASVFERVCRERMTQRVRRDVLLNAGHLGDVTNDALDSSLVEVSRVGFRGRGAGEEERLAGLVFTQALQQRAKLLGKLNVSIGVAFSLPDEDLISVQVDVPPSKPAYFADADTGAIHQSEQQRIPQRRRTLQKASYFVAADHDQTLSFLTRSCQSERDVAIAEFVPRVSNGGELHGHVGRAVSTVVQVFQVVLDVFTIDQVRRSAEPSQDRSDGAAIIANGIAGVTTDLHFADAQSEELRGAGLDFVQSDHRDGIGQTVFDRIAIGGPSLGGPVGITVLVNVDRVGFATGDGVL